MNNRQVAILNRILIDPDFYTITRLADFFKKTERTIYNDLVVINDFLTASEIPSIELSDNGKINVLQRDKLELYIKDYFPFRQYELNAEEREYLLFLTLVVIPGYMTINSIADNLLVSRTTLLKNISDLRKRLEKTDIQLLSNSKKGISLQGTEYSIRQLFIEWSKSNVFIAKVYLRDQIEGQIRSSERDFLSKVIIAGMLATKVFFAENSLGFLKLVLQVLSLRLAHQHFLVKQFGDVEVTDKYQLAKYLIEQISPELDTTIHTNEIAYLSEVLKRLHTINTQSQEKKSNVSIQFLVSVFLEDISDRLGMELMQDRELVANLSNHIASTLKSEMGNQFENSAIRVYMEKNRFMLEAIRNSAGIFENYFGKKISDIELGYISLHISAAIEKLETANNNIRVLLICNSGIGTVQLLKAKLQRNYTFQIIDTIPIFELDQYDRNAYDCIISTVPLSSAIGIPNVCVNVNLTNNDFANIANLLLRIKEESIVASNEVQEVMNEEHLLNVLSKDVKNYPGLMDKIEPVVKEYLDQRSTNKQPLISDFLSPELVQLDVVATDWQDAVVKAIEPLYEAGVVTNEFAKNVVESIALYGPYIVISPDVAFPHGGVEQGAIVTAFSITRLKEPIFFEEEKRCRLLFTLSASDNKSHVDALFSLVELSNDESFRNQLLAASSTEEVISIIKSYERR